MGKKCLKQIRQWWVNQRIRQQILFSLLLVAILGIGSLGGIAYRISRNTVERNFRLSHEATLKNSGKVLDMNLDPMIEVIRSFLNDAEFKKVLLSQTDNGERSFTMAEQRVLKGVAERLTKQESRVNYVAFIDLYGHYYLLSNINRGSYDFFQYYEEHDFLETEWSQTARDAGGREVFFGDRVLGGLWNEGCSLVKYLNNPVTNEPMGYIVVDLSLSFLERSFVTGNEGYETNEYMVIDRRNDCQLVYAPKELENPEKLVEAFRNRDSQKTYLFTSVVNETTGWELVNVIERNELSADSKLIRNTVFLCAGLLAGVCFFLAMAISRTITKPLSQLEQVIEKVGEGERHITEVFDESEVGRIGQKFREMVNTNLELSEYLLNARLKEREAELLLLQAQINPHFLYNTLDSLYCVAIIHGDDQIAEMILALSDNFKLSLNNGERFYTVDEAIRQIENYMKLQNMRFNERFTLHVEVEEAARKKQILTFLLQPFVENALYHGLEPQVGRGNIWVRGWLEGERLVFTVEDDGVGMEDLCVMERGYGIRNVRERIGLHYGEAYGFTAESEKGKGTKITIVLPFDKRGENHVPAGSDR